MAGPTFARAERKQAKLRLALVGPSGSGKTMTALKLAQGLGQRIALIDTEHGSASKYADDVAQFDVLELSDYHPNKYIEAIRAAAGYDVLVIDSLSHAWAGENGVLAQVDQVAARSANRGNSFGAWREVTPLHNRLVNAILSAPLHVICTMRAKTEYAQEVGPNGKTVIRKIGLAPVQRDGMEYEFDVVGDIDADHRLIVTKTRYSPLADRVIEQPGSELGAELLAWLNTGVPDARLVKAVSVCTDLCAALREAGQQGAVSEAQQQHPRWETDLSQATAFYKALDAIDKQQAAN